MQIRCGLFSGAELASTHFEAGQKLDIALIAADVGFADARFLLRCAKLRPAFGQLIPGSGFVFRAVPGRLDGSYDFFATVLGDVERRWFVGGPDSINRKSRGVVCPLCDLHMANCPAMVVIAVSAPGLERVRVVGQAQACEGEMKVAVFQFGRNLRAPTSLR